MVILGMLATKLQTRTLLIVGALSGGFYFSIGIFNNIYMMMLAGSFSGLLFSDFT